MSENPLKSACTRAEFMAAQKAGIWVMTTEDEQAVHAFAEAIREEHRARVAELERKNEILTDAVSKSCSPFISTKEQLRICRDALAAAQPVARTCTDERPCINCFADQGECLGPYVSKEPASVAHKQEGGDK